VVMEFSGKLLHFIEKYYVLRSELNLQMAPASSLPGQVHLPPTPPTQKKRDASQHFAATTQMDRRASHSIHWPNRTAGLVHYVTDDYPPTLRVGSKLHEHSRDGGPILPSTRDSDRGRDGLADNWQSST
jgi:hypothetical protein